MDPFDLRNWPDFIAAGGNSSEPAMVDLITVNSQSVEGSSSLFVALKGQNTDGHRFVSHANRLGAKYALVKKDYVASDPLEKMQLLRVDQPLRSLQEIAKAYRDQLSLKLIAVTGSYGKTMVKDLLQEFLKTRYRTAASPESFNSQIGVPLSLFTLSRKDEIAIIEAAVSEKDEMDHLVSMLNPNYAILTHVGKKHLNTLGSISNLIQELLKLFKTPLHWALLPITSQLEPFLEQLSTEIHFWNRKDPHLPYASQKEGSYHALTIPFQITFPNSYSYEGQITSGFYYFLDLLNIAVKAAWKLGVESFQICKTLDQYIIEPMRSEIWRSPLGATFMNDTYSQDPQSVDKALRFLHETSGKGRKVFLFGGLRGNSTPSDYRRIGHTIIKHQVESVYLIGSHSFTPLIQTLSSQASHIAIHQAPSYTKALELFKDEMHTDDQVLIKGERKEPLENLIQTFHESLCTNLCLVNLAAIEHNIKAIRQKLPTETRIMVMVKALAYGTDDLRIAKFLKTCGIDILGVSYVDEGVALKRAGVTQDIFVLNASDYEIAKVIKWDLEVGVSSLELIQLLAKAATDQKKQIKVHLHIDTGMSRFGCRKEEAVSYAQTILSSPSLKLEGVMTHFAAADDPQEDSFTVQQAQICESIIQEIERQGYLIPWKHAANSSAALRFNFSSFNMVRIGLAVYGLYPSEITKKALELRSAISLISRIVGINTCQKGDTISYGRTYLVEKENLRIAVLPIGYFDGLHRNYSGRGHVMIRGQKAPMVGKICMDYMMVNITDIPEAALGDPVLIFGEDEYGDYLSPENLAISGDSIVHELITCLGPRIQRIFIYEETKDRRI